MKRFTGFALTLVLLLAGSRAHAQQGRVGLFYDYYAEDCHLRTDDLAPGVAYVVLTKSVDFDHIVFKASVPTGVAWLYDVIPGSFTIGSGTDSQTGLTLHPKPSCIYSGGFTNLVLMRIYYTAPASLPPTAWDITGIYTPTPGIVDCTKHDLNVKPSTAWLNNPGANCSHAQYLAPYLPLPPDGDSAPVGTKLGFTGDANRIWLSTTPFTTPRPEDLVCATAGGGSCPNPFDPGLLAPNTTYYWMAGNVCDSPSDGCEDALSDVWSFMTDEPLKVRTSTWGAIKALYR